MRQCRTLLVSRPPALCHPALPALSQEEAGAEVANPQETELHLEGLVMVVAMGALRADLVADHHLEDLVGVAPVVVAVLPVVLVEVTLEAEDLEEEHGTVASGAGKTTVEERAGVPLAAVHPLAEVEAAMVGTWTGVPDHQGLALQILRSLLCLVRWLEFKRCSNRMNRDGQSRTAGIDSR